jgi:hypothetical protein
MPRHTEGHALLPGVEYEPSTQTLFIDVATVRDGGRGKVDGPDWLPLSINCFRAFKTFFPDKSVRAIAIRGFVA